MCAEGSITEIYVSNPLSTSAYTWTTLNGNIVSGNTGTSIAVDTPGTYIVTQKLLTNCSAYVSDTIQIMPFSPCVVLTKGITYFRGISRNGKLQLSWAIANNQSVLHFEVERSSDGISFASIGKLFSSSAEGPVSYTFPGNTDYIQTSRAYYRVKMISTTGTAQYSSTIIVTEDGIDHDELLIFPNPARDIVQVKVMAAIARRMKMDIYDLSGKLMHTSTMTLQRGTNLVTLDYLAARSSGVYLAVVNIGGKIYHQKIMLTR
jgi:hypothetical protein